MFESTKASLFIHIGSSRLKRKQKKWSRGSLFHWSRRSVAGGPVGSRILLLSLVRVGRSGRRRRPVRVDLPALPHDALVRTELTVCPALNGVAAAGPAATLLAAGSRRGGA